MMFYPITSSCSRLDAGKARSIHSSLASAARCLLSCLVSSLCVAGIAHAQQTITYTDGENDSSPITITTLTNPTTLVISSGVAIQSGNISDSGFTGSIDLPDAGTLIFSGENTYHGSTTITAGTLKAGSTQGFSVNSDFIVEGTLDLNDYNNMIASLSGPGTIVNTGAANTNAILTVGSAGSSANTVFSGTISDGASGPTIGLALAGGSLSLTNTNLYRGGTTIDGGTLEIASDYSIGVESTADGVTLSGGGELLTNFPTDDAIARPISISGKGTLAAVTGTQGTYYSAISGGALTLGDAQNAGTLYMDDTIADGATATSVTVAKGLVSLLNKNTYTGGTTVNSGTLLVSGPATLGSTSGNLTVNTGGTLDLNGTNQTVGVLAGTGGVILNGATGTNVTLTFGGSSSANGTFAGVIENNSGTGGTVALVMNGSDLITLTGANTYSGTTTINSGTLAIGNGTTGSIHDSRSSTVQSGAALVFNAVNGDNYQGNIADSGTLAGAEIGGNTNTLSGNISGAGVFEQSISLAGAGRTILTGTNNYTGQTIVAAGTLQFGKEVSLNDGNTANWTSANINVESLYSSATLAFNVGGAGEFTAEDIEKLAALGTSTGGFENDTSIGLDTTNASGGNFTYGSVIADPNGGANALGLTKLGTNTLTLTANNTYTGNTIIDRGTLAVSGSVASIGSANTSVYVGFNNGDNGTLVVANGGQVTGDAEIGTSIGSTGTATVTGINANGKASTWTSSVVSVGNSGAGTLNIQDGGQVTDSLAQIAAGPGTSGTATVSGVNANATASAWTSSGYLEVGLGGAGTLTVQDGGQVSALYGYVGDYTAFNTMAGSGNLTVTGINANGAASTLNITQDLYIGSSETGTLTVSDGAQVTDTDAYVGYSAGSGNGHGGTATVTGVNANGAASTWTSFKLSVGGGNPGTLNIQDGGVVNSSYVYVGQGEFTGILDLDSNGVLQTNSITNYDTINFDGGILQATADTFTGYFYLLQGGAVNLENGGGTIDNNGHSVTTYNTSVGGVGALTSTGSGVFTLAGANTYTGGTTVKAGTLLANGASATGSGAVMVNGGAALGGNGTISPSGVSSGVAVTFASGATLNQSIVSGGLSTSTLTLDLHNSGTTTTVDLLQGAKFDFDLAAAGVNDQVIVTGGTLTLNRQSFSDFTFTTLSGFTGTGTYDLFSTDAGGDILGSLGIATGTIDGYDATLSVVNSKSLILTVATPEPSSWMLGLLALLAFWRWRRFGRID